MPGLEIHSLHSKQESIPVGCVPPAFVVPGGGGGQVSASRGGGVNLTTTITFETWVLILGYLDVDLGLAALVF